MRLDGLVAAARRMSACCRSDSHCNNRYYIGRSSCRCRAPNCNCSCSKRTGLRPDDGTILELRVFFAPRSCMARDPSQSSSIAPRRPVHSKTKAMVSPPAARQQRSAPLVAMGWSNLFVLLRPRGLEAWTRCSTFPSGNARIQITADAALISQNTVVRNGYFFSLTPAPPTFVSPGSRNTTPSDSSARRTASTLAVVLEEGPRALSIRRTVGTDNLDISASLGWVQSRSARAARI